MLTTNLEISNILHKRDKYASIEFKLATNKYEHLYTYIGEVNANNQMNGYGKLWNEDYSFHGNFKDNKISGKGILKYTGKHDDLNKNFVIKYNGNFSQNKRNGEGSEYYYNKEFYKGTFLNDLRHGKGILFNTNGEIKIDSAWELGKSVDNNNITEYYSNGCLEYRGEYNGMQRHGKGVLCNNKGEIIFDGIFDNGKMSEGKIFTNNFVIFQGKFIDGVIHEGTFYHKNGVKLCDAKVEISGDDINNPIFNLINKNIDLYYEGGNKFFTGELVVTNHTFPVPIYNNLDDLKINKDLYSGYIEIITDKDDNKNKYYYTFGTGTIYSENNTVPRFDININKDYKYDGANIEYYDNGIKKIEYNLKDGLYEGEQFEFYSDAKVKNICEYTNNKKNGYETSYVNNNIAQKILYEEDIAKTLASYYENSDESIHRKKYEGDINENLKYSGNGTTYYDTEANSINYTGAFNNGKYHGQGILYHQNGHKSYEGTFENERKHGSGMSFYESTGTIEYTGEWVQNEKHGEGSLFTETGELVYSGNFHYDDMSFVNNSED